MHGNRQQEWRSRVRALARRLLRNHPRLKAFILRLLATGRYLLAAVGYWLRRGLGLLGPGPAGAARRRDRAQMLAAKGNWASAAKVWRRIIARDSGRLPRAELALAWTEYGRCLLSLQQLRLARPALERALALQPDFILAHRLLAFLASAQQNWPESLAWWQGVLDAYDAEPTAKGLADFAECLNGLAEVHISLGQFAEAEPLLARLEKDGGEGQATQLRLQMAKLRFDEQGRDEALARLGAHQKTAGAPPAAEDLQADLLREAMQEKNPQQALQAFAAQKAPQTERLNLSRHLADAFPDSAAVQLNHLRQLGECMGNAAEMQEMQARTRAFCARFPKHPRSWWQAAQAAVIADDPAAAAPLVAGAYAKLGTHAEVEQMRLWLAAKQGDHREAYAIAESLRRRAYQLAEDGRDLDLRPLNRLPAEGQWRARQDRILLFACFRNERDFAGWFLDYYRGLGVEHFFIVDNLSDDGTAAFLSAQRDVTAFASSDSFVRAHCGTRWVNELIRRYGQDNWCIFVDSDEQLLLPDSYAGAAGAYAGAAGTTNDAAGADTALRRLVDGMAARGEENLPAWMLDTYPADLATVKDFKPGDSPLVHSNLIDLDYFFFGGMFCPFLRGRGGVRNRLFGSREHADKALLLRGGGGRFYRDNHKINYAKVSAQCAVLLHHKLLREALAMQKPEAEAARRVADRWDTERPRHARYRRSGLLGPGQQIPRGANAVACDDIGQLQHLLQERGLMGDLANAAG